MVQVDNKVDYAAHELETKRLLKEVHILLLKKDYVGALGTIDQALTELRLMRTAVKSHVE